MGTIRVTRIVVAPLKGNREEYYPDGTADLDCSHSLFPRQAAQPAGGSNATAFSTTADPTQK